MRGASAVRVFKLMMKIAVLLTFFWGQVIGNLHWHADHPTEHGHDHHSLYSASHGLGTHHAHRSAPQAQHAKHTSNSQHDCREFRTSDSPKASPQHQWPMAELLRVHHECSLCSHLLHQQNGIVINTTLPLTKCSKPKQQARFWETTIPRVTVFDSYEARAGPDIQS